jgi:hypothetical protein
MRTGFAKKTQFSKMLSGQRMKRYEDKTGVSDTRTGN